ncbi:hypothetical protein SAVERM_3164 [Streptomyces avermitilis MA-4680 = NBRC 14893]|uniref:Uncharacterized protein n=2 Tax=Streptomyces avermitilis TaxID=33903 RepID=Q82II2_STRAW|nr:hypothetical protein SAVERM_3164 [Streptomyces avermitilis MA-4680 = NBRC 14893]
MRTGKGMLFPSGGKIPDRYGEGTSVHDKISIRSLRALVCGVAAGVLTVTVLGSCHITDGAHSQTNVQADLAWGVVARHAN